MNIRLKVWQIIVLAVLGLGALCTSCVAVGAVLSTMGVFLQPGEVNEQVVQVYAQQTYASMASEATQIPLAPAVPTMTLVPTLVPIPTETPTAIPLPPTPALPVMGRARHSISASWQGWLRWWMGIRSMW